jgi:RNA 2',3'-cyclic 3'-phosphodiesterase
MLRAMSQTGPHASDAFARLFVGLWPGDTVRDAVQAHAERWAWMPSARRVPRAKLHMTLHFLGGVPRERLPELVHGLTVRFQPFVLRLDHAEVWRSQVAVLSPRTVPPGLTELHERLQVALGQLQQPTAREALLPHVTLARQAKGSQPAAGDAIRWDVDGYALIESTPDSRYHVLYAYR